MRKITREAGPQVSRGSPSTAPSVESSGPPAQSLLPNLQAGGLPVTNPSASLRTDGARSVKVRARAQKRSGSKLAPLIAPHKLRLTNQAGLLVEVPASNYYLDDAGKPRAFIADLVRVALSRSPADQLALNRELSGAHAGHEMSFRVKDPVSGHYDKIFEVPVHGSPIPITEAHFNKLIRATEPVMRALRDMLRVIYSTPHLSAKDLGIEMLSAEDQERILGSIKESIYFEPALRAPQMKDYPFLTVGGFDAALGKLENQRPVFFEYNLGTPSGLSNNVQLIEELRKNDPETFATFQDRLPPDQTFAILKRAIDSNAKAWTKNPDGISVVISPGVYNGAHPDVASIAMFTGMPLVNPSDLYQDAQGDLRLNTGAPGAHPIVTGIYGRAEESFFLQSNDDQIPIRSPEQANNVALGERLGVKLEPGVVYQFEYDGADQIIGVKKDAQGRPKLQEIFESIGRDPSRPEAPRGSFAKAILNRKLYYSGLGGRVVDDKRVFQAIAEHIAPKYLPSGADLEAQVAHPPRTLRRDEYQAFYRSKQLERYVVKEPDKSGGDGVMLMANLLEQKRREVVEAVKSNPGRYIIQEFAESAVMMSPEDRKEGPAYSSLANDWRLFSIIDGEGKVDAGPNSVLLRVAKAYSASTNTSQGAGYGIGVVLSETPQPRAAETSVLPEIPIAPVTGHSRRVDLEQFISALNTMTATTAPAGAGPIPGSGALLASFQRAVMDLLGRDFSPMMTLARSYDEGKIDRAAFHAELIAFRNRLYEADRFNVAGLSDQLRLLLAKYTPPLSKRPARIWPKPTEQELRQKLELRPLKEPMVVRKGVLDGAPFEKLETAIYVAAKDPTLQKAIAELTAAGGSIREIRLRNPETDRWREEPATSYFRVDDDGNPVIGVSLPREFALTSLAHEMEHFRMWNEWKARFVAQGADPKEAARLAKDKVLETAMRVEGERRSLNAELKAEADPSSIFNRGERTRPREIFEEGYVARMAYPEVEGVRDLLHRARWSSEAIDRSQLDGYLKAAIALALQNRKQVNDWLLERAALAEHGGNTSESESLRARAHALLEQDLFGTIFTSGELDGFKTDQTLADLETAFWAAFRGVGPDRFYADARDATRLAQQQQQ